MPLARFEPADTKGNRHLIEENMPGERLLVYLTRGEYWGKDRSVVITYNPSTARKQQYTFENKLETIRQELLSMRVKVRDQAAQWR